VDVINGLNHYIGMKTLHTDDFPEFVILPYLIGFFALFFFVSAIVGRRRWIYVSFFSFLIFGIVAMVDFWLWEYNYGHNLDPNAAIQVPGMSYQPPLIGFKQLLNFGAYSVPDIGGWLFVAAGLLLLIALLKEGKWFGKKIRSYQASVIGLVMICCGLGSCGETGPEPIVLNKDMCAYCRMAISDGRFGAELVTKKGRIYKFDDLSCMLRYDKEQTDGNVRNFYINDYTQDNILIHAENAWYISHDDLNSPMRGNMAAFEREEDALDHAERLGVATQTWTEIMRNNLPNHYHVPAD
jgi:copper chaperone NosL